MKSAFILISLAVITLGNWSKAWLTMLTVYASIVTNFTDRLEHQELAHVRVNSNLGYVESVFGHARMIKASALDERIAYRYYFKSKYLLTLAVKNDEVLGYQVVPLTSFQPVVPFLNVSLNTEPLAAIQDFTGQFSADNYNATYYLEHRQLAREGLFYNLYLGFTDYGETHYLALQDSVDYNTLFAPLMESLLLNHDAEILAEQVSELRQALVPNVFTVGHITLEQASEMLLTRHEFVSFL